VPAFFFPRRSDSYVAPADVPKFSPASNRPAGTTTWTVLALLLAGMTMVMVVLVARWAGAVGVAALAPILRQTRILVQSVLR
jgi:hypothetical protein